MDDLVAMLGGSEVMLPSQFNDLHRGEMLHEAERRLWLQVFLKVLDDWRIANSPNGRKFPSQGVRARRRDELTDWFQSDAVTTVPASFRWLCEVFGANHEEARRRILYGGPLPIEKRIIHHGRKTEVLG